MGQGGEKLRQPPEILQQGGNPSPFNRIQAMRLTRLAVDFLVAEAGTDSPKDGGHRLPGGGGASKR